jgi:hypothetical protein
MEKALITEKWIEDLAQDIQAAISTKVFEARWALIELYHYIGGEIKKALDEHPDYSKDDVITVLSKKLDRSRRTLYYAVEFYETYPDLNMLPEGPNISWNKIVTKYLTTPKEKVEEREHEHKWVCVICGQKYEDIQNTSISQ